MFKYNLPNIDVDALLSKQQAEFGQNLFVIAVTQGKRSGYFLEIGACHPYFHNNTYMLEKEFDWQGTSVDYVDYSVDLFLAKQRWNEFYQSIRSPDWPQCGVSFDMLPQHIQQECIELHGYNQFVLPFLQSWQDLRPRTNFLKQDATTVDYSVLPKHIDYLQIDIDSIGPSLDVLHKVLQHCSFSVITFEHDMGNTVNDRTFLRAESRRILKEAGYELLINDVTIPPELSVDVPYYHHHLEDWYVNPLTIDQKIIKIYKWINESNAPKFPHNIIFQ
jgi:hypothetical protein